MTSKQLGLVNKGLAVINAANPPHEATFAVVGLPRSGTSMVSSLLQSLGIFMGDAVDKAVYEDVEVSGLIEAGDFDGLKEIIAKRNAQHAVWGFKRPDAYKNLPRIVPLMRNPRIVVMFRDVLAIAIRNHVSMQMDIISALPQFVMQYSNLVQNITGLQCPMLLISYEKFLQFPEESIEKTASFVGVEMSHELRNSARKVVSNGPDTYLQSSRLHYTGHVDRISQGKLRGWAMVIGQPKLKANIAVWINGNVVTSGVADMLRPDLVSAGLGDGHHGFELFIGNAVEAHSIIEVTAGNANFVLPNSGRKALVYESF